MFVEILTPDNTLFSGEAELVTLPGSTGSFQVKHNHAALISSLQPGTIEVKSSSSNNSFNISGGLVEVISNKVTVLV
jgi:F-type H+-transporting ATPase subunit epsilon